MEAEDSKKCVSIVNRCFNFFNVRHLLVFLLIIHKTQFQLHRQHIPCLLISWLGLFRETIGFAYNNHNKHMNRICAGTFAAGV
jgi:hypothetical protein